MNKDILVTYFSATGTTRSIAKDIARQLDCELYEIKPVQPYTQQDLNWNNKSSRSSLEANDISLRPEIEDNLNIEQYKKIYVGFPIWWYRAPNIIATFLENHDFTDKQIVLFATSGGSSWGKTAEYLKPCVSKSCVIELGKVYR